MFRGISTYVARPVLMGIPSLSWITPAEQLLSFELPTSRTCPTMFIARSWIDVQFHVRATWTGKTLVRNIASTVGKKTPYERKP